MKEWVKSGLEEEIQGTVGSAESSIGAVATIALLVNMLVHKNTCRYLYT